jgi:hypothetical protein
MLIRCECGKTLPAKPEWAGIAIRCAGCGRSHTLNEAVSSAAPPEAVDPDTRDCVHCGKRIKAAAIKCRYCQRMLEEREVAAPPAPARRTSTTDDGGLGPLLVGLFAWVFGCWLPSPVAWIMGSMYESDCRARGLEPSTAGRVGKILWIVGTIFLILSAGLIALCLLVSVGSGIDGCR